MSDTPILSDAMFEQFLAACVCLPEGMMGKEAEALRCTAGRQYLDLVTRIVKETKSSPMLPPVITVYPGRNKAFTVVDTSGHQRPHYALSPENPEALSGLEKKLHEFYEPFGSRFWEEQDHGVSYEKTADKLHAGCHRRPFDPTEITAGRVRNTWGHINYYKKEATEEEKKDAVTIALLLAEKKAISPGMLLRVLRVYSGKSADNIAKLLGITQTHLSRIENHCIPANISLLQSKDTAAIHLVLKYCLELLGKPIVGEYGKVAWSNTLNLPTEWRDDLNPPGVAVSKEAAELFLKMFGHDSRSHASKYNNDTYEAAAARKAKAELARAAFLDDIADQINKFKSGKIERSKMATIGDAWKRLGTDKIAKAKDIWDRNPELREYFHNRLNRWMDFRWRISIGVIPLHCHDVAQILQKELQLDPQQLSLVLKLPCAARGSSIHAFHPVHGRDMIDREKKFLLDMLGQLATGEMDADITPNQWLRRWREAGQFTQCDVAKNYNVTRAYIEFFENKRPFVSSLIDEATFDAHSCLRFGKRSTVNILSPANPYRLPMKDGEIDKRVAENLRRFNDRAVEKWLSLKTKPLSEVKKPIIQPRKKSWEDYLNGHKIRDDMSRG